MEFERVRQKAWASQQQRRLGLVDSETATQEAGSSAIRWLSQCSWCVSNATSEVKQLRTEQLSMQLDRVIVKVVPRFPVALADCLLYGLG
jgi:hypothetical protein